MAITTKKVLSKDIRPYIDDLANLRITIFKEYPYLYKGEMEYEQEYLSVYADSADSVAILAFDDDRLIGAVTAIPMQDEMDELSTPIREAGLALDKTFYIGELLFLPEYRGVRHGSGLARQIEEHIRNLGSFTHLTCATVMRPSHHPLKPGWHLPIDYFLACLGFEKMNGVVGSLDWPELDGTSIPHLMQYWIKEIA